MVDMAVGQVVAGWRIERELARGGMGVLYLAQHPRLPRLDVLKVLPAWLAEDERFRERFLREGRRVSSLAHPHVVVVHDSGEHEGMLYLAMQYVPGGDLRARLAGGPVAPERALHLTAQVASALDAAHRAGIVHRDVKPENVLLADTAPDEPEHAVLTDFGISRDAAQMSTLTATGELLLTPAYAAPEQISATNVDGRADQYALACMLFEMLAGRPPYGSRGQVAMLAAHLTEPVAGLPSELGLPDGLDQALRRAMDKAPENRFPSCREFLAVAQAAVPSAPSAPTWPPTPRAPWAGEQPIAQQQTPGTTPVPAPDVYRPTRQATPAPVSSPEPPVGAQPARSTPVLPPPVEPWPPGASSGPGPGRRRRTPIVAAALVVIALAGGGVAALALRGGSGDASGQSGTQQAGGAAAAGSYEALLARIPENVRGGCEDRTSELREDEAKFVSARAACNATLPETASDGSTTDKQASVVYDAVRGDASVATTYRRDVLGVGGTNNAPGDCRTRERDPNYADRPANRGLYMPPGPPPLDVETWCDFDGTMYLLEPNDQVAIYVQLRRADDDGDISAQQQRYDDLAKVRPS